jgi:hypothetical protein
MRLRPLNSELTRRDFPMSINLRDSRLGRRTILAITLGFLCCLPGCIVSWPQIEARATKQATFPLSPETRIEIETQNGAVMVVTDPAQTEALLETTIVCRGETQDEANERLAATEIVIDDSEPGRIRLHPRFPEPKVGGDAASFSLRVPSASTVQVKTSNGSVHLDGDLQAIQGDIIAKSSNGGITVSNVKGNTNATTSNGSVHLSAIEGDAELHSTNGRIEATDVTGKINAKSSNGSIQIELLAGQMGPISAVTSNSRIQLHVAEGFQGKLRANTSNAPIRVDDPNERVTKETITKSSGEIVIGDGSEISKLATSNGAIVVHVE